MFLSRHDDVASHRRRIEYSVKFSKLFANQPFHGWCYLDVPTSELVFHLCSSVCFLGLADSEVGVGGSIISLRDRASSLIRRWRAALASRVCASGRGTLRPSAGSSSRHPLPDAWLLHHP